MAASFGHDRLLERFELRPGGSFRTVFTYTDPAALQGKPAADSDVEAPSSTLSLAGGSCRRWTFISDDPAYAGTMML